LLEFLKLQKEYPSIIKVILKGLLKKAMHFYKENIHIFNI